MAYEDTEVKRTKRYPSDVETESGVIGACLSEGLGWWHTVDRMSGDSGVESLFFDSDMRLVAEAMSRSATINKSVSTAYVVSMLNDISDGDHFLEGPQQFLIGLTASTGITHMDELTGSINRLKSLLIKRDLIQGVDSARKKLFDPDVTPYESADDLRKLSSIGSIITSVKTAKEILAEIDLIEVAPWRVSTGIKKLDRALRGGYEPGRLNVVAARPKVGKTTFILNVALNAAIDQEFVTMFVSLEMNKSEIMAKMIASLSFIEHSKVLKILTKDGLSLKDLAPDQREAFKEAREDISESDLHMAFSDDISDGVNDVVNMMMTLRAKYGEDIPIVVFIDYLQLLIKDKNNPRQEMDHITRVLKTTAMDLQISIIAPSQINRSGAEGGMPSPSQMKESGGIEQDADTVVILHRKALDDEEEDASIIDGWLALSRVGPTTNFEATWAPEFSSIEDPSDDEDEEFVRNAPTRSVKERSSKYLDDDED